MSKPGDGDAAERHCEGDSCTDPSVGPAEATVRRGNQRRRRVVLGPAPVASANTTAWALETNASDATAKAKAVRP